MTVRLAPVTGVEQMAPKPRECTPAPSGRTLDAESRAWVARLHGVEPVRRSAIAELHERLRGEARFEIHKRARRIPGFPMSDVDDLAVQAASDALMTLLRKLDDYRGDSQFWTWARRFAQLEAPVSIRRRQGHGHLVPGDASAEVLDPPDIGPSPLELVELRLRLRTVTDLIVGQLTPRQRSVVVAIAINGDSPAALASELDTTPGAIYKTLHDARAKLKAQLARSDAAGHARKIASRDSHAAAGLFRSAGGGGPLRTQRTAQCLAEV